MRITIQNNQKETSVRVAEKLRQMLTEKGFQLVEMQPDIVITIGGDGTLLSAFHRQAHRLKDVRFIGIHTGHLGFYTDWREYQLEELVESIAKDKGDFISYPLLDVEVFEADEMQDSHHFLALNEATIQSSVETLVCDVFIDDFCLEKFRGDGICVATPTGSTGYNKSLGGAVLSPRLEVLQMTEIASINNRIFRTLSAPLVISKEETISVRPAKGRHIIITVDHMQFEQRQIREIRLSLASERIRFYRDRHPHFWQRVSDAFIGETSL
ncbi:NAD kinase [Allofustis seminis]|uniref:NAD kinase n=1 Tax=Allofustis seminis TaxID=166939 RepID=UPI000361CFDD|nr:NAD kinase [Allofustis seminis]